MQDPLRMLIILGKSYPDKDKFNPKFFYCFICQIGNWSRWLIDTFGMDYNSLEDGEPADDTDDDDDDERLDTSFKSFYLLNALSDLMMLPKDMLLSKSIRKEVYFLTQTRNYQFFNPLLLMGPTFLSLLSICGDYLLTLNLFEGMPYFWYFTY